MDIIDFLNTHAEQADALALMAYKEERGSVPCLPLPAGVPDLTDFANQGLGVAAFENHKMVGFLCCCSPFEHAFRSTDVRGVFSPMGANAAIKEKRGKIYAAMYQAAAAKWVMNGAVSHGICLYAHDKELQEQFYRYGFGLRCMDAIRPMTLIDSASCVDYDFSELSQKEYPSVYPLDFALNLHYRKSPSFMKRKQNTQEEFTATCKTELARYFAAKYQGDLCAFLKISDSGETFAARGDSYCHIRGAYCRQEHRGKGVYQNLLNTAISVLKTEGYIWLGVNFESINPTAYGFWLKYFTPYTHGVVRRIDERILT